MKVCYSDFPVEKGEKSLFLAGPTIRKEQQKDFDGQSWRIEALNILQKIGYDGIVYVPEYSTMRDFVDKDEQFEWEWESLHSSSVIVFWVPRKFPELPAMTTNVEFGFYLSYNKNVLYGRPDNSDKNGYLDRFYKKYTKKPAYSSLEKMLVDAVEILNKNF